MNAVVVDTDVVSFIFKRDPRARLFRSHLVGRTLVISFMTFAELLTWPRIRRWSTSRRELLRRHVARYQVHYVDEVLCDVWAQVVAGCRAQGRPIESADAWIAATALDLGVPLVTHNPDDYAAVEGLALDRADEV